MRLSTIYGRLSQTCMTVGECAPQRVHRNRDRRRVSDSGPYRSRSCCVSRSLECWHASQCATRRTRSLRSAIVSMAIGVLNVAVICRGPNGTCLRRSVDAAAPRDPNGPRPLTYSVEWHARTRLLASQRRPSRSARPGGARPSADGRVLEPWRADRHGRRG
jgi:hypothetical protein